ncbi:RAD55 family ATPase [Caldimonas tepidiphila]|uniref:RAD55 family ATPase n=1 Tax=Caldimonas tepidiphila TaxID=2315841 RepID=UPI0013008FEB|nr:DnaB-like helicase C-terminal domain-containing protein [Caldimonas tepidiphila]
MQRLISELRRLFLLPGALHPETALPDAGAVDAALQGQLAGREAAGLPWIDPQGRTRLMVVGFHGVPQGQGAAHCSAMLQLGKALMEELGLPEPAFSVNGHEGFDLWLPLAQPLPATEVGEFLGLLRAAYLKGLPALSLWPAPGQAAGPGRAGPTLPPALHPATGLWSVFVAPGLAPSFTEEAGIDVPPNLDKQAELLARLQPVAPGAFAQAVQALRERLGDPVPAAPVQAAAGAAARAPAAPAPTTAAPPVPVPAGGPAPGGLPGALAARRAELFRALAGTAAAAVDTPFPALSRLLHGGFRGGRLYALLAPPKSGKTTLAASWLEHAAANGHPALYAGYEMARGQLVQAALARRLCLEACRIEAGALTEDEAGRAAAALDAYLAREGRNLEIWEAGPATGLADIAAWVRAAAAALPGRTPLVVIDPLPLAAGLPASAATADALGRAAARAAACKDLARGTGAAVIALCALSRPLQQEAELAADPDAQALLRAADGVLALQARMPALQDAPCADGAGPARVRLQLLSHRGRIGEVALDHWRAFHLLEEAPGSGTEAAPAGDGAATEAASAVFRRHADASPSQRAGYEGG